MTSHLLERLSKTAALASTLLIVALQIAFHPDGTAMIRALAVLALITGWLAAHASRQTIHAFWIFLAPLAPALLRALTGNRPLKQHGAAAQHEAFVDAGHPVGGGHAEPALVNGPDK